MRRRLQVAAVLLLSVVLNPARGQAPASPDQTPLFDAQTLSGWTQRGGQAHYRVEAGQIVGTTAPNTPNSFLCTNRNYTDFIFEYEFKVDPRLNSGVQVRSNSLPTYKDGVVHGYQIEIDPSDRAWTAGIYDESRRGWLCDLKENEAARHAFRPNEWNHVRVAAHGDRLQTWLNNVPACDLHDGLTRTGFIALQVHATSETQPLEVRWRSLRIEDLGDPWQTPPKGALGLLGPAGDLAQWQHVDKPDAPVAWTFADGALTVAPGSGNIATKRTFGDCRVHVEFNVDDNGQPGQANGNSGVYLQGRYEIQVLNSCDQPPAEDNCGAIYKVKPADYGLARPAGEWQTYDIEFHAPRWDSNGQKTENACMTVYHNGTRIHDRVRIPQQTGAGRPEGPADGPLLLQDHGNRIRFRNIWIEPLAAPPASQP